MLRRTISVLLPVLTFKLGAFTLAFGYGTRLGHPISTVCFFGGLVLFISSIVSFILVVKDNYSHQNAIKNYTSLINILGFYIVFALTLVYFLSGSWSEFNASDGQQSVIATFLAIALAGIIYNNYSLGNRNNSNYTLAACSARLLGFFGCVSYLLIVEDGLIKPVSSGSGNELLINITKSDVFIGTQKDTTYYKTEDTTLIDKQGLD